jgi:hypothetical protein
VFSTIKLERKILNRIKILGNPTGDQTDGQALHMDMLVPASSGCARGARLPFGGYLGIKVQTGSEQRSDGAISRAAIYKQIQHCYTSNYFSYMFVRTAF